MISRRLLSIVALLLLPPALVLAAATALGWLRFQWSLEGVGTVAAAYVALEIFEQIEDPHAPMVREQLAEWRGE